MGNTVGTVGDLAAYSDAIHKGLDFVKSLATTLGYTWADAYFDKAKAVIELFIGPKTFSAEPGVCPEAALEVAVGAASNAQGLPPWLTTLLITVVKSLLGL